VNPIDWKVRAGYIKDYIPLPLPFIPTLQTSADSVPANIAAGSVLDTMGKGEEARKYFAKAIDVAGTPEHKAGARRAMAMSYAFEGNCAKTIAMKNPLASCLARPNHAERRDPHPRSSPQIQYRSCESLKHLHRPAQT
jgi:hypothetical protein